jgi:cytochrome c
VATACAGGKGTRSSPNAVLTVGSYLPYATTLFDYVRREIPLGAPKSLSDEEVYAVASYIIQINGIIGEPDIFRIA